MNNIIEKLELDLSKKNDIILDYDYKLKQANLIIKNLKNTISKLNNNKLNNKNNMYDSKLDDLDYSSLNK